MAAQTLLVVRAGGVWGLFIRPPLNESSVLGKGQVGKYGAGEGRRAPGVGPRALDRGPVVRGRLLIFRGGYRISERGGQGNC